MSKYFLFLFIPVFVTCSIKAQNEQVVDDAPNDKLAMVWSDEFESAELNSEKWEVIVGDGCPDFCGFGNNELQYYSDREQNVRIENGNLIITAFRDTLGTREYTSAKLITKRKGDWKYGRVEVRARVPQGRGTWPAIWMMPTMDKNKWPLDGEIDIMEHVGYNQGMVYGAVHTEKYNGMRGTQKVDSIFLEDVSQNFHVYSLAWDENSLTWYVDDQKFQTFERNGDDYESWPFDKPFHLILNLAVGGNWGGKYGVDDSIWPQTLEVDWVRVYQ